MSGWGLKGSEYTVYFVHISNFYINHNACLDRCILLYCVSVRFLSGHNLSVFKSFLPVYSLQIPTNKRENSAEQSLIFDQFLLWKNLNWTVQLESLFWWDLSVGKLIQLLGVVDVAIKYLVSMAKEKNCIRNKGDKKEFFWLRGHLY